jgi:hypothetical protein
MCPTQQIPELSRLETVIEIIHVESQAHPNEAIDLYRLHDYFTTTDEPEDDVADENYYIGWEFGYGRPDLRNYVFENDEVRAAAEQYLRDFWPVERSFGDDESERVCEDEDGDDEGGDEGGQAAGGDGDGERVRTNTDTINPAGASAAGASATEEDEVSTISRYTNPDAFVAPTPANTPTLRFARLPTNNNATARAVQGEIAMNRHTNTDNPFAPTPANTPTQRSFRFVANNTASARAVQAHND